jgi:hypothetical protein
VALANGRSNPSLIDRIRDQGYRFSFFQAVRLIQALVPGAARVGHQGPVDREALRFCPTLDFVFAASDVAGIRETGKTEAGPRFDVMTTAGLYGTVTAINEEDDTVLLSIAPGVEVKFAFAALRDMASLPGQYRAGTSPYPEHESGQAPGATQTEPDEARPDRPAPERPDA